MLAPYFSQTRKDHGDKLTVLRGLLRLLTKDSLSAGDRIFVLSSVVIVVVIIFITIIINDNIDIND